MGLRRVVTICVTVERGGGGTEGGDETRYGIWFRPSFLI